MDVTKVIEIAHALYRARGDKAEVEAAQKERHYRETGDEQEAETWRRIRGSIRQMRGANES
ncbi:hypothetical protein [Maliponia aquimaris]|uniref:Uncharacterized protein n=1 Tax=Maliponia aquimaris TaxID=1673631 RepID=A0A238JS39_9RHOB|nr:hypothetical protein [Maliponia aquimaris]SMX33488.1 hypothetical protein MAA8898_00475 [Maliponia aquimaris]